MDELVNLTSRPSVTFVTCLFDPSSWEAVDQVRGPRPRYLQGAEGYLHLSRSLLRQRVPLVIFTEPSVLNHLTGIQPPSAHIRYHVSRLNDLPLFKEIYPRFCELFHERYYRYVNPVKDTPSYLTLVNSKWSMLRNVANTNPYDTKFIGWIDIGLAHVVGREMDQLPQLAGSTHHPPCLCLAMPNSDVAHPPRDLIMRQFWGRISAGLLTMPTADALRWEELCTNYLRIALSDGYYPFECEILYRLLLRMGRLSCEPDIDVSEGETATFPAIQPYHALYANLISRHPATHFLHKPNLTDK